MTTVASRFRIPYSNIANQAATIKPALMAAFESVLDGGRYINGDEVAAFEKEFAALCGTSFARGVGTGTCALHLVLGGLKLQPDDEVITAPNSFLASAAAATLAGGRATFADVGADLNIDPQKIEAAITPRTRAIMPVHLTGRPARMPEILAIARKHQLFVLEDAAQAVGASLDGRPVGAWGDAAGFSLHPLKNLHAYGDAGVVTTNDAAIAERLSLARNHGLRNRDTCEFFSFNSRLDELHAALLRVQMRQLAGWTAERRRLAFRYNEMLRPYVTVPDEGPGQHCVYQTYVVQAEDRDRLQQHLQSDGIEALVHYATPIHLQPAARHLGYSAGAFPAAEAACRRILSLPLYPGLTDSQQDVVVASIREFCTAGR